MMITELLLNKTKLDDFWNMVELRMKMFNYKYGVKYDLPEWTSKIRIENIFRQLDRTCLFIQQRNEFKNPINVALFTLLNSPLSWIEYIDSNAQSLNQHVQNMRQSKKTPFHSAYLVNGARDLIVNGHEDKFKKVVKDGIKNKLTPIEFHNALLKINGIGQFMAHQIVINLQLRDHLPYDEDYVKLGPGSSQGLRLLELPVKEDSLRILLKLVPKRIKKLTPSTNHRQAKDCVWTLETIENCLCIYQKMHKFVNTGKTKRRYTNQNKATATFIPDNYYIPRTS